MYIEVNSTEITMNCVSIVLQALKLPQRIVLCFGGLRPRSVEHKLHHKMVLEKYLLIGFFSVKNLHAFFFDLVRTNTLFIFTPPFLRIFVIVGNFCTLIKSYN